MLTEPQQEEMLPGVPKKFRVIVTNRDAFDKKSITFTNLPAEDNRLYSGSGSVSLGGESEGYTTVTIFVFSWKNYSGASRPFYLTQSHVDQIKGVDDHLELHL
jgi:hypothetical protein